MSEEEYADSHITGSDSDATFRILKEESDSCFLPNSMLSTPVISTGEDDETELNTILSKPVAPIGETDEIELKSILSKLRAPIVNLHHGQMPIEAEEDFGGIGPNVFQHEDTHSVSSKKTSSSLAAAATRALADYSKEPSARPP